MTFFSRNLF